MKLLAYSRNCAYYATEGLGFRKRTRIPAATRHRLSTAKPAAKLPVSLYNRPTITGPRYPPKLPIALTKPMPDPAASCGRISVGIAQNGPIAAYGPAPARQMKMKYNKKECSLVKTATNRNRPPRTRGAITWNRRSPDLSECCEFKTIAMPDTA